MYIFFDRINDTENATPTLQLLNFFKMAFYLFSVCSILVITILMPINWKVYPIPFIVLHELI
jgi:hypothetical protein